MAGKYFYKARFVDFLKRFTKSELQQKTSFSQRNAKDNGRIQKVSDLWQYVGWNYYRRQIQEAIGRILEVPATGSRSLRRAKKNVMQLIADSRKQIRGIFRNGELTKAKLQPRQQSLSAYSDSMMENGKIRDTVSEPKFNSERQAKNILLQYDRDSTFEHEQRLTEGRTTKKFTVQADLRRSLPGATLNLGNNRTLPLTNDSLKHNSAVSLRTPEADVPRALMLTVKPNDEVVKSPPAERELHKTSY